MTKWWRFKDPTPGKQLSDLDIGLKVLYVIIGSLVICVLGVAIGSC